MFGGCEGSELAAIVRRIIVLVILACAVLVAGSGASGAQDGEALTNLSHLDYLGDTTSPPSQAGYTTYRLDEEPELRTLWTYAEPDGAGSYRLVGGGAYDAETNTYDQGAYNTDDMTRAAVVYLRHWRQTGSGESREAAYGLLRTVAYMQTVTPGPNQGNFVLWMQPDGTLNPSAEPVEQPDPSDSGPSYWLARSIWAYGEGYEAFEEEDPEFAAFLEQRMELALDALDRQVLSDYGQTMTVDGREVPAWLVVDGADASAEAVYGLAAYTRAGGGGERATRDLEQLAEGISMMSGAETRGWPFGAILPWAPSRSLWHGWADQMSGALATAGMVTGDRGLISTSVGETGTFTPHLLVQGGAEQAWGPAPVERAQIAYAADATLQNLIAVSDATGRESFRQLAGIAGAWYFGNNRSGVRMYDPETGRTYDGLEADGRVNRNSGAESTIHGLLSMLALDANPDVREAALQAGRAGQLTWSLQEAEAGDVSGRARIVRPDSAWTGESLWSGGAYVEMRPGSRVTNSVDLPENGRYRVLPVFERQQVAARSVGTRHALGGVPLGISWQGGAGEQGVSAAPGYLDIGNVGSKNVFEAGQTSLLSAYVGEGRPAKLDALLVQPEIERLLLEGNGGSQALLRSWADTRRVQAVDLETSGGVTAYSYDAEGRLVRQQSGSEGAVNAPVEPGGFTYVKGD